MYYHNHLYGIENKPWFNFFFEGGGGGASASQAPPPTSTPVTSVASFSVLGGGGKTPKYTDQKFTYTARASEASERLRNIHFQDSKYICLHIQSMHFPLLMVWRYKRYYTDKTLKLRKKSMNMRASEASKLKFLFLTFSHAKAAISFNILLVLQILCLRNIFPLSLV